MKHSFKFIFLIGFLVSFKPVIAQDTWLQKANFPFPGLSDAASFSIGDKGYLVGGFINGAATNQVWEYDPATNAWSQKLNFTGGARGAAVGFSIGNKGYVGLGLDPLGTKKDFWQYDPNMDKWTKIADFPPGKRYNAVAFTADGKGYVGTGNPSTATGAKKDFYAYDPISNSWTQIPDLPSQPMAHAVAFSLLNKGYVGLGGVYGSVYPIPKIWEYDPQTNIWQEKTPFSGLTTGLWFSFTLAGRGYLGTGLDSTFHSASQVYEYDPISDSWSQKNDFGGGRRVSGTALSIGNYAYAGLGHDSATYNVGSYLTDWWQYTPTCAGYTEICGNGIDDNCNGLIDENCCQAPGGLTTSNITGNSAQLNWTNVSTATKYKVFYKRDSSGAAWITKTVIDPSTSLVITGLLPSSKYKWKVKSVCNSVKSDFSSTKKFTTLPLRLSQMENEIVLEVYPNPLRDETVISFQIVIAGNACLELTDLGGRIIMPLVNRYFEGGEQTFHVNTSGLSSGLYILQMKTAEMVITKKIMIDR